MYIAVILRGCRKAVPRSPKGETHYVYVRQFEK